MIPDPLLYTVNLDGYDRVRIQPGNGDRVLFSDGDASPGWQVRHVPRGKRRESRWYKILSHRWFPGLWTLYCDANVQLLRDPRTLCEFLVSHDPDASIWLFRHNRHKTLSEEADAVRKFRFGDHHVPEQHLSLPVAWGGVILRSPNCEDFNEAWWDLYQNGSERDQLTLPIALQSIPHKLIEAPIPFFGDTSEWMTVSRHLKRRVRERNEVKRKPRTRLHSRLPKKARQPTHALTMVHPGDGWILDRLAQRFAQELKCAASTRPNPSGTNVFFNYEFWAILGKPKTKRNIGLFTHRKNSEWERIAEEMDWCIAMSNQSLHGLPPHKTTMIECPPDDEFRIPPVIGICSSRAKRKRLDWIPEIKRLGLEVRTTEGHIPREKMRDWYDAITHLVVIGEKEGGPLPFFEALGLCKTVIAPNVGVCWDYPCIRYDGSLEGLLAILRKLQPPTWKDQAAKISEIVDLKHQPDRYQQLLELIAQHKPESIIEVGTYDGSRAIQMIEAAMRYRPCVSYRGYDLFELADARTNKLEFNLRRPSNVKVVEGRLNKLKEAYPGLTFKLLRGFTRNTLPEPRIADFVFIDGGHSVATIQHDLSMLRGSRVIVMDDWYEPDESGRCPDISKFGCNLVIKDVPHEVLPVSGPVCGGGLVKMVLLK